MCLSGGASVTHPHRRTKPPDGTVSTLYNPALARCSWLRAAPPYRVEDGSPLPESYPELSAEVGSSVDSITSEG